MKIKIETIRKAVLKNRGRLDNASDNEIMIIWNSLTSETQKQYLDSVKDNAGERKTNNASGTKS